MLSALENFFLGYVETFLTGEEEFDRNIVLKREHSLRVRDQASRIAEEELSDPEARLDAVSAALLHDLGRFEQFRRFRTYHDAVSIDHGNLSAELTGELVPEMSEAVREAIRVHNKLAIPEELPERTKLLARVVRDADKIDIMTVLFDYLDNPVNEAVVYGLSTEPVLSPKVRADLEAGRSANHSDFRTVTDFFASKLTWIDDLNFAASRRVYRERGYLDRLARHLPATPEIADLVERAREKLR